MLPLLAIIRLCNATFGTPIDNLAAEGVFVHTVMPLSKYRTMQYNTQRDKLVMPEYGRAVQDMVQYALSLTSRDERLRCAQTIVEVMGNMQPAMKDNADYKHKLWDHLACLSHYELDIDYPYPITRLDEASAHPQPLAYPKKRIGNRHYGYLLERLLDELAVMPEGEERDKLLEYVANHMKQTLHDWYIDAMDDEKIAADIARYTDGRVRLDLSTFKFDSVILGNVHGGMTKKKKKKK